MCNALTHVEKSRLVLVQSDAWPCWLLLWFVSSTYLYLECLLSGVIKRKRLRLVHYGIPNLSETTYPIMRPINVAVEGVASVHANLDG